MQAGRGSSFNCQLWRKSIICVRVPKPAFSIDICLHEAVSKLLEYTPKRMKRASLKEVIYKLDYKIFIDIYMQVGKIVKILGKILVTSILSGLALRIWRM
jgi:hypothetical protein